MLVLQVREREQVFLDLEDGRRVVLTVLETRNGSVRLGFEADKSIRINRINRSAVAERANEPKGGA